MFQQFKFFGGNKKKKVLLRERKKDNVMKYNENWYLHSLNLKTLCQCLMNERVKKESADTSWH